MALFASQGEIVKLDDEKHFALSPVLIPNKEDKSKDIISEEEIEKSAHRFMEDFGIIGEMHSRIIPESEAKIVESYITRDDLLLGDRLIPKGSWMLGVKIYDPLIWEAIKKGEYKGLSVGGFCKSCVSRVSKQEGEYEEDEEGGRILRDLIVQEVSIVSDPAVPDAKWVILKNKGGVKLKEDIKKQDITAKLKDLIEELREGKDKAVGKMEEAENIDEAKKAMDEIVATVVEVIAELETLAEGYGYAYPAPTPAAEEEEEEKEEEILEEIQSLREEIEELKDKLKKKMKKSEEQKEEKGGEGHKETKEAKEEAKTEVDVKKLAKEVIEGLKPTVVKEMRKEIKPKVKKEDMPSQEEDEEPKHPKTLREAIEAMLKR